MDFSHAIAIFRRNGDEGTRVNGRSETGSLRNGSLGPVAIAFFVISAAGPLVAMAGGIPVAMLFGNGPGLPAMFLVATLILLAFAAGYTAMAREVRNAGAFYAFAARGLGGKAAGSTGMVALLSYNGIQIGLYGLFGSAAKTLLDPLFGIDLPWWIYALGAMISIAFLGYRQVDLSARILGVLVAGEYLVVLLLDMAIVSAGGHDGLSARSFSPHLAMTGAPAIGLMLCFSAFVGFEATTIYSEEAKNPEQTIPLATYFSVLLIGGFYTVSTWAVVNGAGVNRLMPMLQQYPDPTRLLFDLADHYVGSTLPAAMRILFVTSTYAALLAFHNAIARYLFAMGREGILPAPLGRTHAKNASPHIGSLIQSMLAFGAIICFAALRLDPVLTIFTIASGVATLGILILMATTALATLRFFAARPLKRPVIIGLSAISCACFTAIAALAAIRFDVLTGSTSAGVMTLPALVPVAALAGVALATRLKRIAPERYARLGATMV